MTRMILVVAFGVSASLVLSMSGTAAPQVVPPKIDDPNALRKPLHLPGKKEAMAMKLKQSQAILEAIALHNFEKLQTATEDLFVICDYNEFLNAYKGDEYRFQLKTFRRTAETIAQKTKDKNMDGVMMAFQDMTQSCLKCHQAMRDKKFEVGHDAEKSR